MIQCIGVLCLTIVALGLAGCMPIPAPVSFPSAVPIEGTAVPSPTMIPADRQAINTQLILAAGEGDVEQVSQLLAQGANVTAQDEDGRTALIAAAYRNHLTVAGLLIEAGADVNIQDETRQSAYLISTSEGYLELLHLTLEAGADVHSKDSYNGTGLIRAAERGHIEIIQELLKTDIDVDHVNNLGWTALLEAIILGDGGPRHTEVVRLLVESGADVNLTDSNGISPLAHASRRGYQQIMEVLRAAGAR
ncbi:MAG TPA: ankyrin repeat domain-containing protein [Anaerolineales bacterium]|nr:ankyrin repeat domain-containing protein [Anaerolineales bacterium]